MKRIQTSKRMMQLVVALFLTLGCVFAFRVQADAAITAAPTGLKQTGVNATQMKLEWSEVYGTGGEVPSYYVMWAENVNFTNYKLAYTKDCEYVIDGAAGKAYYVRVGVSATAQTSGGAPADTKWSAAYKAVTPPSVSIGSLSMKKATSTSVTVSWQNVAGVDAYKVMWFKTVAEGKEPQVSQIKQQTVTTNSITLSKLSKNSLVDVYVYPVAKTSDGLEAVGTKYAWNCFGTQPTKKVSGLKCTYFDPSVSRTDVDFRWNHITFAGYIQPDGYQYEIYKYSGGKKLASGTTTKNYVTVNNKKLKKRQFYKIRVRPYVQLANKQKKTGAWSSWTYFARSAGSDVTKKLVNPNDVNDTRVKLTWKKVTGAQSYSVYYSTSLNGKYTKLATVKSTNYTIDKNLTYFTTYYVRIVPNRKVGKKNKNISGVVNSNKPYSTAFRLTYSYY